MWGRQEVDRINGTNCITNYKLKIKLTDKAVTVDPQQQWLNDSGGRMVIGWVVMEIGRFYCVVWQAVDPINLIVDHKK